MTSDPPENQLKPWSWYGASTYPIWSPLHDTEVPFLQGKVCTHRHTCNDLASDKELKITVHRIFLLTRTFRWVLVIFHMFEKHFAKLCANISRSHCKNGKSFFHTSSSLEDKPRNTPTKNYISLFLTGDGGADFIFSTLLAFVFRWLWQVGVATSLGSRGTQACLCCCRFLLLQCPIEGEVILMVEGTEQDPEELSKVEVVWLFLKAETSGIIQVHCKLRRKPLRESKREGETKVNALQSYHLGCSHITNKSASCWKILESRNCRVQNGKSGLSRSKIGIKFNLTYLKNYSSLSTTKKNRRQSHRIPTTHRCGCSQVTTPYCLHLCIVLFNTLWCTPPKYLISHFLCAESGSLAFTLWEL